MSGKIVVDTDVIIDFLRGVQASLYFFGDSEFQPILSTVTITELYAGIKSEQEVMQIEELLTACEIREVSAEIARIAGTIRNQYDNSHGTGVIDSIIAATAIIDDLPLATLNQKHYPMIEDLILPYSKE